MLATLPLLCTLASGQERTRLPLRVLYAGDGDTERARDFVAFFAERALSVRVATRDALVRADLDAVDVVVIDGDAQVYAARIGTPAPPTPPPFEFLAGVPTVLVAWVGLTTGSHWKLKTSLFLG